MHTLIMLTYSNNVASFVLDQNFVIGIILHFGSTKTRNIELGLELMQELEVEKQTA